MITNQREFDKVYSITVFSQNRQNVRPNQQYYFDGYPWLRDVKVKAISISNVNAAIANQSYISLSDRNKNIVVYLNPTSDLDLSNQYPNSKLSLYNLDGVDLLNSYWLFTGAGFSWVATTKIMNINFYY